jgi:8-oxo-dGTP pyrophosphatase MutT (NUDIX family)
VAAKELKEECGIDIALTEMKHLGTYNVSPGGCDVTLHYLSVGINPTIRCGENHPIRIT